MKLLSNNELENLSPSERKEYYKELKEYCLLLEDSKFCFGQKLIQYIYPMLRNYKLEIEGEENIPKDTNVIFVVNHSNSHDIFTAYEVLSALQRKGSAMVATDCLNPITTGIFNISNATLLDRRNGYDRSSSAMRLSKKVLEGYDGVIFGESTWNLHPILPMHNIKQGASKISAITGKPIVPTIFEYIEENDILDKEKDLFKKCVIRFGKPIIINYDTNLISQTDLVRAKMIENRTGIWNDYGIKRDTLDEIDPNLYVNHTYLKKFKAFGFTYDSRSEQEYLLFLNGEPVENEYCINSDGKFVPGITDKNKVKRFKS